MICLLAELPLAHVIRVSPVPQVVYNIGSFLGSQLLLLAVVRFWLGSAEWGGQGLKVQLEFLDLLLQLEVIVVASDLGLVQGILIPGLLDGAVEVQASWGQVEGVVLLHQLIPTA